MQNHLLEDDSNVFAPIIIPTLNRVDHLRRCIDSLARNKWADHTDIYISVDYPPAAKYEEGYKNVCQLLEDYDFSCYKSHSIIYQEKNLGPYANFAFLESLIRGKGYTRYILTEDDNEFSPNFLEYINRGLDLFYNDVNIFAICGCTDTNWSHETYSTIVKTKLYSAYGVGVWIDKTKRIEQAIEGFLIDKKTVAIKNMFYLLKHNQFLFSMYVLSILCTDSGSLWRKDKTLILIDSVRSIYMHLTNVCCICPVISTSQTFGNDGSGVHMPASSDNGKKKMDTNKDYIFSIPSNFNFIDENYIKGNQYLKGSFYSKYTLKAIAMLFVYYLLGKNRNLLMRFSKIVMRHN